MYSVRPLVPPASLTISSRSTCQQLLWYSSEHVCPPRSKIPPLLTRLAIGRFLYFCTEFTPALPLSYVKAGEAVKVSVPSVVLGAAAGSAAAASAFTSSGNTGSAVIKAGDVSLPIEPTGTADSHSASVTMPPMSGDASGSSDLPSMNWDSSATPSKIEGRPTSSMTVQGKAPSMPEGAKDTASMSGAASGNMPSFSMTGDVPSASGTMPSMTGDVPTATAGFKSSEPDTIGGAHVSFPYIGGGTLADATGTTPSVSVSSVSAQDSSATVSVSPIRPLSARYSKSGEFGAEEGVGPGGISIGVGGDSATTPSSSAGGFGGTSTLKGTGAPRVKRLSSGSSKVSDYIAKIENKIATPSPAAAKAGVGFGGRVSTGSAAGAAALKIAVSSGRREQFHVISLFW